MHNKIAKIFKKKPLLSLNIKKYTYNLRIPNFFFSGYSFSSGSLLIGPWTGNSSSSAIDKVVELAELLRNKYGKITNCR